MIRCGAGRPPGPTIADGDDGALFSFLACSKHSVVADPESDDRFRQRAAGRRRCRRVVSRLGLAEHADFSPEAIRRGHPHLTVTAITPFGLHGPWRDRPATEFTLQAWSGGIVGLGRGSPDRAPRLRRRPGRRIPRGGVRQRGHAGLPDARWRRADRPVDARDGRSWGSPTTR